MGLFVKLFTLMTNWELLSSLSLNALNGRDGIADCFEDNIKVDSLNNLNVGICVFMESRNED